MSLIDTHAHLYEDVFKEDEDDVINGIRDAGIIKILLPNTDTSTINSVIQLEKKYPNLFASMLGVHPDNVKDDYKHQISVLEKALSDHKYIGIGEVGLDYYESTVDREVQKKFLDIEISLAQECSLPMSIHVRNAFDDAYKLFKNRDNGNLKGVIHCFTGTIDQANMWIDLGFKLGIGGIVTFKKSTLPDVLKHISLDNTVLETDSPCLTPEPHRGKRNDSRYLTIIADKLSIVYNEDIKIIETMTTKNAKKLFNI